MFPDHWSFFLGEVALYSFIIHLVPLPTPRRPTAQLRARLNHFYLVSRLENPDEDGSAHDTEEAEGEHRHVH